MKKAFPIVTIIVAALFAGTLTLSAQEVKNVEKKVVVVTVEENGIVKDSTVIEGDTIRFEGGNLIIETGEGKRIIRKPGERSRMVWTAAPGDFPGRVEAAGGAPGRVRTRMPRIAALMNMPARNITRPMMPGRPRSMPKSEVQSRPMMTKTRKPRTRPTRPAPTSRWGRLMGAINLCRTLLAPVPRMPVSMA